MDITKIRNNEKQLQALTSLKPGEFDELLIPFTHRFEQKYRYRKMDGKRRRKPRSYTAVRSDTKTLPTVVDKLFFILYHFKIDAIQFAEAAFFGLSQGQASRWIAYLRPVLMEAIEDLHLQPARTIDELIRLFRNRHPNKKAHIYDEKSGKILPEQQITPIVSIQSFFILQFLLLITIILLKQRFSVWTTDRLEA